MRKRKKKPSKRATAPVTPKERDIESPFEKYRGIGNPGIPRGRKAVLRWCREIRGR